MAKPPPLALDPTLQWFEFKHLPDHLKLISAPFHEMAHAMCAVLEDNPERRRMLIKLLEAKDCAVRAKLFTPGA